MAHAPDSVYQALFFPLMATGTSYQDQEGEGGEIISHEDESLTYGSLRGVSEQANGQESDFLLIDVRICQGVWVLELSSLVIKLSMVVVYYNMYSCIITKVWA